MTYKQCILQRNKTVQVSWIPSKYAKVGNTLELKGEDGWKVIFVSKQAVSAEQANEMSQEFKHQRKASDI